VHASDGRAVLEFSCRIEELCLNARSRFTGVGLLLLPLTVMAHGSSVPGQFQGTWAADSASCPDPEDDLLKIRADQIDFYERSGKVIAIRVLDRFRVEIDLDMWGQGDKWHETLKLTLAKDQRTLTDINSSENPPYHYSRVRCAK
jgi:hypothetical protein